MIDVLVALKVIKLTGGDTLAIRRAVGFFLTNLANKTQQQDAVSAVSGAGWRNSKSAVSCSKRVCHNVRRHLVLCSQIGEDLFALAVHSPFRFPATFTFVRRR